MSRFPIFLLTLFFPYLLFAQWGPDVRLTAQDSASSTSYNNARCAAVSGDTIHAVWYDTRAGNNEIYYKRSTDGGNHWTTDVRLTNDPAHSDYPAVAVAGSIVHVAWADNRDGNGEIYAKRSTDGGTTWGPDTRLTYAPSWSYNPAIAASDTVVEVVWFDNRDGNAEVYAKHSSDGGLSWGADVRLTNNPANSWYPAVAISDSLVHVAWYDNRDGNWEIYYKRSTDGGLSWEPDTRLTNDLAFSSSPTVGASGAEVCVVWQDTCLHYKYSGDGGSSWSSAYRLPASSRLPEYPSVAVTGTEIQVVWKDERNGNREIYAKRSSDGGLSWGSDWRLTNDAASSSFPSIAISGANAHVVWVDERDGNQEIYYKGNLPQWEPDQRLTFDGNYSFTSSNYARCVAASGDTVHVVWYDRRDGNYEIYYKRSSDDGTTWGPDTRLTDDTAVSYDPSIGLSNPTVHVVWTDRRDGRNGEVYYKRSPDGGMNWSSDTRLTYDTATSDCPVIAVSGETVHLVWSDSRDGRNCEVYYKRSLNGGLTWGSDVRLTTIDSAYSGVTSVTVLGSQVHVAWMDRRDQNYEIYYKRSSDGGSSWGPEIRLSHDTSYSYTPSIAASGSLVHVAWTDRRGTPEIYYARSTDCGLNWDPEVRLTSALIGSYAPSIAASGQNVHVVWCDERDGGGPEIYYKRSQDGGINWSGDIRLTNAPFTSQTPSIALSGDRIHVVWSDDREGNYEIYYKRNLLDNASGVESVTETGRLGREVGFKAVPNPFSSFASIPGQERELFILYDISGRRVGTYRGERIGADVPSGVYFLLSERKETKTVRIVKIR